MHEEDSLSFNFWPSFADMMLALVLVLCLALFLVATTVAIGKVDLKQVEVHQMQMIESIAKDYQVDVKSRDDGAYGISFGDDERADIVFHNDLNSQRITFSDYLLFARDDAKLKPDGEVVVRRVGARLNQQLAAIREIQIQGHADTRKTYNFPSNVELAYHRAVAVFDLLRNEVGIKPEEQLMSVTSFGEFLSVQRSAGDGSYTEEQLTTDNASDEMRQANRRIELVVIYRR